MKQGFRPASIPFESFFPDENLPPGNDVDKDVVLALLDPHDGLPTDAGKFRQYRLRPAKARPARRTRTISEIESMDSSRLQF